MDIDIEITCCYLTSVLDKIATDFLGSMQNRLTNTKTPEEVEIGRQYGAQQMVLMMLIILKVDGKLCDECSDFEKDIADEYMKRNALEYMDSYQQQKNKSE